MAQITVSGMVVDVIRKNIKNLHLAVHPPNGRVRISAPMRISDEAIRLAVITRLGWIKRNQAKFAGQERQSPREYVTGETHYYQGQRYRLNVISDCRVAKVVLRNSSFIDLYAPNGSTLIQREQILARWYRRQLKALIPELLAKWEAALAVRADEWGIKRMKTKWGTCNPSALRIWLNLELAKKPIHCLEYIIVHELAHFFHPRHDDGFKAILDRVMPQWKTYRESLNQAPLAHENWKY